MGLRRSIETLIGRVSGEKSIENVNPKIPLAEEILAKLAHLPTTEQERIMHTFNIASLVHVIEATVAMAQTVDPREKETKIEELLDAMVADHQVGIAAWEMEARKYPGYNK